MQDDAQSFSARERDVLAHIADGKSSKEIANALNLSPRSVERYIENCRYKLNARNKAELVAKAIAAGFVELPR